MMIFMLLRILKKRLVWVIRNNKKFRFKNKLKQIQYRIKNRIKNKVKKLIINKILNKMINKINKSKKNNKNKVLKLYWIIFSKRIIENYLKKKLNIFTFK